MSKREVDYGLTCAARGSCVAQGAGARELVDLVNARGTILTGVRGALVDLWYGK